jgi:CheY-like chemotaxis protein
VEAPAAPDVALRILLIDDERDVVLLLKESLAMCGQTVFASLSGREALDILGGTEVDAVICDLAMPEMSGWEVGSEVRALCIARRLPRPLFVLLTGWGAQSARAKSLEGSGVDAIVGKPVDAPTLLAKIKGLMPRPSPSAQR